MDKQHIIYDEVLNLMYLQIRTMKLLSNLINDEGRYAKLYLDHVNFDSLIYFNLKNIIRDSYDFRQAIKEFSSSSMSKSIANDIKASNSLYTAIGETLPKYQGILDFNFDISKPDVDRIINKDEYINPDSLFNLYANHGAELQKVLLNTDGGFVFRRNMMKYNDRVQQLLDIDKIPQDKAALLPNGIAARMLELKAYKQILLDHANELYSNYGIQGIGTVDECLRAVGEIISRYDAYQGIVTMWDGPEMKSLTKVYKVKTDLDYTLTICPSIIASKAVKDVYSINCDKAFNIDIDLQETSNDKYKA